MKRILLFIATNIAVLVVMSVILSLLGVDRFLTRSGLNLPMLMVFSLVVGFHRIDHLLADEQEHGQVVHRRARDRNAHERYRSLAAADRGQAGPARRDRHAGGGGL